MSTLRWKLKRSAVAIAALLAAGGLLLGSCAPGGPNNQTINVATAEKIAVATGTVENRVIATGKVVARSQTSVAFPRSGVVAVLNVKEGQSVRQGDVLAALDTKDLKLTAQQQYANYLSAQAAYSQSVKGPSAADLAAARAAVNSAQAAYSDLYRQPTEAELAQVRADLQNAEADLKSAQANYDRRYAQNPAGIGGAPESVALEKATNNYNRAKASYDAKFEKPKNGAIASASSSIQQAKKNLEALKPAEETAKQREAQMQQAWIQYLLAEENVKNATIVAPFDGLVTKVNFAAGDWMNTGAPAVQIADFSVPIFEVDVDEADLGGIKAGQDARVRLQTYPDLPLLATVESVSTVGTNNGTVVNYKVKLALGKTQNASTTQPLVLINMSGTSEIVTARAENTVVVPNRAITIDAITKDFSVQKVVGSGENAKAEKVAVKLGYRDSDQTQVIEGVSVGDTLIIPVRQIRQQQGPPQGN